MAADGTLGLLCRLLPLLRAAFPRARFLVRLDGGFATPEIFDFLDAEPRLDYVVAMAKNAVLQRHAESAMQVARAQSEVRGETAHVYTDTRYAAGTWDHERRVVIKAKVVRLGDREPRDNPRFVVTNLRQTPRFIYEKVYCARGDIENRIKELLDGLQIDRTSCCLFSANQLRVFLTAAAYVLMQELRWVRLFFVGGFFAYSWAFLLADGPFRFALRVDSARTAPTRLFSGSQPGLITAPGRCGPSPPARRDVPMKTVSDLLGHARLKTTAIYAKLDRETLATIALPWPGGAR